VLNHLEKSNLFNRWLSDDGILEISCFGEFYLTYNKNNIRYKDIKGYVSHIDPANKLITVKRLIYSTTYQYSLSKLNVIQIKMHSTPLDRLDSGSFNAKFFKIKGHDCKKVRKMNPLELIEYQIKIKELE
jgi:hypothetical protein